MKTIRYIAAISLCTLLFGCQREQMTDNGWERVETPQEGMRFGVDLSNTKSVFVDDASLQLQWRGDETITVVSAPAAFLDVWGNESVAAGDFSAIHFGNYTVSVDPSNPAVGTVLTKGTYQDWAGGPEGEDSDLYAFMAWTPAIGLEPGLGEENGYFTACNISPSQPDADYSKYQVLYASNLEYTPENPDANEYVFTRGEILGGASVTFSNFEPATSMIRFRMKSEDENNHTVSKIVIQSEDGCPIAGKAGLQPDGTGVSAWTHFFPTQGSECSSEIVIEFSTPIMVGKDFGDWYHAVVIPGEVTGKITFIAYDETGKEILYAEKAAPAGGFDAGVRHKIDLTMGELPEYFFYFPSIDAVLPCEETTANFIVASYHLDRATGERTTLAFNYAGAYYDPECNIPVDVGDTPIRYFQGYMVEADDTQIDMEFLGDGKLKISVPVGININQLVLASDFAGVTAQLRGKAEVGSQASPVNLATVSGPTNTANCYIVNGPGWYSFPLVYGNAIKDGTANEAAYNDYGITDPQISGAQSAYVVWTDAYVPFDATTSRADFIAYGSEGHRSIEGDLSLGIKDGQVVFHLPAEGIDQGNLVIGVKNASGQTLWSWHIWVTDYAPGTSDIPVIDPENSASQYYFMQRPLGYCPGGIASVTSTEGELYVKWVQAGSNKEYVIKTTQQAHSEPYNRRYSASSTNYQFGRKEPFYCYSSEYEKTNAPKLIIGAGSAGYGSDGYLYAYDTAYTPEFFGQEKASSYWDGVHYPEVWYGLPDDPMWVTDPGVDLWKEGVKTIFDPCPAGYRIPDQASVAQFCSSGFITGDSKVTLGDREYDGVGAFTVNTGTGSNGTILYGHSTTMSTWSHNNGSTSIGFGSTYPGRLWINPSSSGSSPVSIHGNSSAGYPSSYSTWLESQNALNCILPVRE